MRKAILCLIWGLLAGHVVPANAQSASDFYGIFNHLSVGANVSTLGVGLDVATNVTKYIGLRAGISVMPGFNVDADDIEIGDDMNVAGQTLTIDKIRGKASFNRTTFEVLADIYPLGNSIFITGGFSFGGNKIVKIDAHSDDIAAWYAANPTYTDNLFMKLDDYKIPIDRQGNARSGLKVSGFRPYLGIGFGSRAVPKSRVGFRFEIGAQFHGKPKVVAANGLKTIGGTDFEGDDHVSKWIDKGISIYPVLKFRLCGRII